MYYLIISENSIGDEGAKHLSDGLKELKSINQFGIMALVNKFIVLFNY